MISFLISLSREIGLTSLYICGSLPLPLSPTLYLSFSFSLSIFIYPPISFSFSHTHSLTLTHTHTYTLTLSLSLSLTLSLSLSFFLSNRQTDRQAERQTNFNEKIVPKRFHGSEIKMIFIISYPIHVTDFD